MGQFFPLEWVLKSSLPDYTVTVLVAGEVMMSLEDKVRENIFSGVSNLKICSSEDMDLGKLEHSECVHKHLKKLVINPEGKYCSGLRQSWDEGEREKVYQKLHEFSKDAVLTIH
ncbi:hypothetical protein OIU76_027627 [Salix suchowensis]|nr:hypothetical protein OIU76_027627 [Salix suchowensis]